MLDWKLFAILAPLFFASFQSISKLLPKQTPPLLVGAYSSLVAFIVLFTLHLLLSTTRSLSINSKSLLIIIIIGVLIGLGNFSIFKAYNLGAPQSIFTLIAYVLLIIFGIIFGIIFWQEKLSASQMLGAFLSIIGLLIIIYYRK
jgi:uncharacterized membrane protein